MDASGTGTVASSGARMASATLVSRVLGLARELSLAAVFGAGAATDAFAVAYRIPNMLRDLLAEGSLSSAFVPVFVREGLAGGRAARRLLWSVGLLLLLATGAASALIGAWAAPLVRLATGGAFEADPAQAGLAASLVRIMAPYLCLVSLAALAMGALNALGSFFLPALAPAFFNGAVVAAVLVLPGLFAARGLHPALALGWGVLAGGALQLAVQAVPLLLRGHGPAGRPRPFSGPSREVLRGLSAGALGSAAAQVNVLVSTVLAAGSGTGAVSWLSYAFRLFQFPVGVLGVSIAGSNLVHFSSRWKSGDRDGAAAVLASSWRLSWAAMVPAAVLLWALAEPAVRVVLERGAFGADDTERTAAALRMYALGLPFYGLHKVLTPTFFSLGRPGTPVLVSALCVLLNVAFCVLLVPRHGYAVLALGTSVSMAAAAAASAVLLRRALPPGAVPFPDRGLAACLLAGAACWLASDPLTGLLLPAAADAPGLRPAAARLALGGLLGLGSYLALLRALGGLPGAAPSRARPRRPPAPRRTGRK